MARSTMMMSWVLLLGLLAIPPARAQEDAPQPSLRLTTPSAAFEGRTQVILTWESSLEATAADAVTIYYSTDQGQSWQDAVRGVPDRGEAVWTVPNESAFQLRFKLHVIDNQGRPFVHETGDDYSIKVSYPHGVLLSPKRSDRGRVDFAYFIDPAYKVGRVDLWARLEQSDLPGPWRLLRTDGDRVSPVSVDLPDGRHELTLQVFDDSGNGPPPPRETQKGQLELLVDTRPPAVILKNFHGGVHPGGKERYVSYEVQDEHLDLFPIDVDISSDDGANWVPVEHGLPLRGALLFTLPREEGPRYRLRVRARDVVGHVGEAVSAEAFLIDSGVPDVRAYIASPTEDQPVAVSDPPIYIQFDLPVETGPAPLKQLRLFWTTDGGRTWQQRGERGLKSPIAFEGVKGSYGFTLVVTDAAGNEDEMPLGGSAPELRVELARSAVVVELDPLPARLRGFEEIELKWKAAGDLDEKPAALLLSLDGGDTWETVIEGLAMEAGQGSFKWAVPARVAEQALVRLRVYDRNQNMGEATSQPLVIAVDAPVVELEPLGRGVLRGDEALTLSWKARGMLAENPVTIEMRLGTDGEWLLVARDQPAVGTYPWRVPRLDHPMAFLRLRARDEHGQIGECLVGYFAIDSTPPTVTIFEPGAAPQPSGHPVTLRWRTLDNHSGEKTVTLRYTLDQAPQEPPIATGAPDQGVYAWRLPEVPAGQRRKAQIELAVLDKAGNAARALSEPFDVVGSPIILPPVLPPVVRGGAPLALMMSGLGLDLRFKMEWSLDGGSAYRPLPEAEALREGEIYTWQVPRQAVAQALLRISAVDAVGRTTEWSSERAFGVGYGLRAIQAYVREPGERELWINRIPIDVQFGPLTEVEKQNVKEVQLYHTSQPGTKLRHRGNAPGNDGPVPLEVSDGEHEIAIVVRDLAGEPDGGPAQDIQPELLLHVDTQAPRIGLLDFQRTQRLLADAVYVIRWQVDEPHPAERPIQIEILRGQDEVSDLLVKDFEDKGSYTWRAPLPVQSELGDGNIVKVRLKARDRAGNIGQVTSAPLVLELRPELEIEDIQGRYRGGSFLPIRWHVSGEFLGPRPIGLAYSLHSDLGPWVTIAEDVANSGEFIWRVPETINADRARVRIRVSNQFGEFAAAVNPSDFEVDSMAPKVKLSLEETVVETAHIDYFIEAGAHDLVRLRIYFTPDEGKSWQVYADVTDFNAKTIAFTAPEGTYGFYVTTEDAVGNSVPAPQEGTQPQYSLNIYTGRPSIRLRSSQFENAIYRGGQALELSWESTGKYLIQDPVRIEFFDGEKWAVERGGLPAAGSFSFMLPRISRNDCRVRLLVRDIFGREPQDPALTPAFTIDSQPAVSRLLKVDFGVSPIQAYPGGSLPSDEIQVPAQLPPRPSDEGGLEPPYPGGSLPEPGEGLDSGHSDRGPGTRAPLGPKGGARAFDEQDVPYESVGPTPAGPRDDGSTPATPDRVVKSLAPDLDLGGDVEGDGAGPAGSAGPEPKSDLDRGQSEWFAPARRWLEEGREKVQSKEYLTAKLLLKRVTDESEDDYLLSRACYELATIALILNEDPLVVTQYFRRAVQHDSDFHEAWNDLGYVHYRENLFEDARQAFVVAARLAPKQGRYRLNLGMAHYRLEHDAEALKNLNQALALDPKLYECYLVVGDILARREQYAQARRYYEDGIAYYGVDSPQGRWALPKLQFVERKLRELGHDQPDEP